MRQFLRRSRILRALRRMSYPVPYLLWCRLARVRPDRHLFLSDSHDGFVGNFAFLRAELLRRSPDAEIIGVFKRSLGAPRPWRDRMRLPYLMATSRTITLDDFYPLIYPIPLRPDTRLIQVWHAAGAFKQVGHSRVGLPGGPAADSLIHRNYTDVPVSSEAVRADYAEAFGIPLDRVRALGVPRTDAFFDGERCARVRAEIRSRMGVADDKRLVLFAPTFRGSGQLTAYADDTADWSAIARALGPGHRVAVRRHPFTQQTAGPLPEGIIDGSGGDMNDMLLATDVLVTDYSSSIFEFALLRRPFVLFVPDLEDYASERSFYRPFERYAIGPVVREPSALPEAIRDARVDEDRLDAFLAEFCDALDGRSSERIVRELFLSRGGDGPAPDRAA